MGKVILLIVGGPIFQKTVSQQLKMQATLTSGYSARHLDAIFSKNSLFEGDPVIGLEARDGFVRIQYH